MQKEPVAGERIFVIYDFLSPEECDSFIAASEQKGYEEAPITTHRGFVMRKDIRDNLRVMVDDPELAGRLFARARPFLPGEQGIWQLLSVNERFRYYRYDVGQTFKPHYDGSFDRSPSECSFLTFLVYLNDDFTGGETNFYDRTGALEVAISPRRGMALVFEHPQLHEGAAVKTGRKYVLRTDVMYRLPVKGEIGSNGPAAPGSASGTG